MTLLFTWNMMVNNVHVLLEFRHVEYQKLIPSVDLNPDTFLLLVSCYCKKKSDKQLNVTGAHGPSVHG
jgi:hypothetical protein